MKKFYRAAPPSAAIISRDFIKFVDHCIIFFSSSPQNAGRGGKPRGEEDAHAIGIYSGLS